MLDIANTLRPRRRLYATTSVLVDGAKGSDDNDGLTSAVRTITRAYEIIRDEFDLNSQTVAINLTDGVYTESLQIAGHLVGNHLFFIEGNPDPSKVVWRAGPDGYCIFATDAGIALVKGVTFEAPNATALQTSQGGTIDILAPTVFGNSEGGTHVTVTDGGNFNVLGPYSIAGDAVNHLVVRNNGRASLGGADTPATFTRSVSVECFLSVSQGGVAATNGTPVTYISPELCTGTKYLVAPPGNISCAGTVFPGAVDGIAQSGHEEISSEVARLRLDVGRLDAEIRKVVGTVNAIGERQREEVWALFAVRRKLKTSRRMTVAAIALGVLVGLLVIVLR